MAAHNICCEVPARQPKTSEIAMCLRNVGLLGLEGSFSSELSAIDRSVNSAITFSHNQLYSTTRNERVLSLLVCGEHFLGDVLTDVLEEVLKLSLHMIHLLAHVENDLHTRQVYTQVASEVQNQL